ncbi:hypothetical protein KXD93_12855 [Mucilaginibacter sp. BJC16-A38]|uniref:hypothetical protein n=1 Tax=Mucilaginibacter phenanthrenivorans TaxID=1234842 RepID=UPI002157C199|nr:hypothetical protein [Mucilaginibacter phenanthrenivorans]MCR8558538.1 hypothetical protein [Mucilaginibacter phenanthrenivorans]
MNDQEKITPANSASRRRFVWKAGAFAAFAAVSASLGLPFFVKKNKVQPLPEVKCGTVRMLTQDGRLVEIDASLLTANRKKVTDNELKNWIKK